MSDLTNLSYDISPEDFFQLVKETVAGQPLPDNARPERAQLTLSGDGGGVWNSGFVDGAFTIDTGDTANPPIHIALSLDDWREFVAGKVRDAVREHVDVALLDPAKLTELYGTPDKVDQVNALKGTLRATIEDGDRHYVASLATGGADPGAAEPTASVAMTLEDFALIASGQENPQMAFFSGKIRVDGDMNHVMGIFALTMTA
jgi:putative sterol carrier protein